jgi:biotin/methionine sulfoxide reductase
VFNARGACLAGVRLDDGVLPGVVVMATGAWFDADFSAPEAPERAGTANVLTRDVRTSQLTQGPNAMSCLVEVERSVSRA